MRSRVTVSNRHPDSLYPDGDPAYWRMWDLLDVSGKGEAPAAMEAAALAARVKGAKQSQTVVKERAAVMDLGENGYMAYRLGQ